MHRLEISDLDFCELVNELSEVRGGLLTSIRSVNLHDYLLQSLLISTSPILDKFETTDNLGKTEVYSDPEIVVSKLNHPQNGISGYEVISNGGRSRSIVSSGGNSLKSFSSSSSFSSN